MSEGEKLVPRLRFPEFQESNNWKSVPLNQLATRGKQKNRDEKIVRVLTPIPPSLGCWISAIFLTKKLPRKEN